MCIYLMSQSCIVRGGFYIQKTLQEHQIPHNYKLIILNIHNEKSWSYTRFEPPVVEVLD